MATPTPAIMVGHDRVHYREKEKAFNVFFAAQYPIFFFLSGI